MVFEQMLYSISLYYLFIMRIEGSRIFDGTIPDPSMQITAKYYSPKSMPILWSIRRNTLLTH